MASAIRFHTQEQLGPNRRFIEGGYLLCTDVPIARCGTLTYAEGEVPLESNGDGLIMVERHPDDVFADRAITSFQGQPLVITHPMEDGEVIGVTPENWKTFSIGTVLNPRRGDGVHFDNDYLYADFLVQDRTGIDAIVNKLLKEVSAGYDAEYEQVAPGRGRQRNIVGNHVALVDRGRCGPTCAVGDADTVSRKGTTMAVKKAKVRDTVAAVRDAIGAIRRKLKTIDADGTVVEELDKIPDMLGEVISGDEAPDMGGGEGHHITLNLGSGMGGGGTRTMAKPTVDVPDGDEPDGGGEGDGLENHPLMKQILERLANIEETLVSLVDDDDGGEEPAGGDETDDAEPEMEDKVAGEKEDRVRAGDRRRGKTGDSASLSAGFTDMLSRAEILAPGVGLITFDSAAHPVSTLDRMCGYRRRVLKDAYTTGDGKAAIDAFLGGKAPAFHDKTALPCDQVTLAFNGASELLKRQRTGDTVGTAGSRSVTNGFTAPTTAAALNARFAAFREKGGLFTPPAKTA